MAQVLPEFLPRRNSDFFTVCLGSLLHDHAIRAVRHDATRHDPHAFAGADGLPKRLASEARTDFRKRGFAVGLKISKAHRPAIHRGIAVRRNVHRRNNIFRENMAQGRTNRQAQHAGNRRKKLTNQPPRLVHRHGIRIVIIRATGFAESFGIFDLGHGFVGID